MKNRRTVRLRVEALESRWVPSAGTPWPYLSSNWSGYSVDAAAGAVTDVKGTWTVPTVTVQGRGTAYAASWVGIDGDNSNTVEQIGTDSDQASGKAVYYAWYEMYPAYPVYLDGKPGDGPAFPIKPGDTISAEVSFVSVSGHVSTFKLSITDANTNQTFTTTQTIRNAARSSAEWIMEAPSSGTGVLPLANFGSETFYNTQATINGNAANLGTFKAGDSSTVVYKLDIANRSGKLLDNTSELSSSGSNFSVAYGATQPPPPSNGPPIHAPLERLSVAQGGSQLNAVPPAAPALSATSAAAPVTAGAAVTPPTVLTSPAPAPLGIHVLSGQGDGLDAPTDEDGGAGDAGPGALLSWLGLRDGFQEAASLAASTGVGNATAGTGGFDSGADPYAALAVPAASGALPGPSAQDHFAVVPPDQLLGAIALAALLPGGLFRNPAVEPPKGRRLQVEAGPRTRP